MKHKQNVPCCVPGEYIKLKKKDFWKFPSRNSSLGKYKEEKWWKKRKITEFKFVELLTYDCRNIYDGQQSDFWG